MDFNYLKTTNSFYTKSYFVEIKGQNIEALINVLDSGCGREGQERKSEMFLRMIPTFMKF
jgi:hypothetical protein